MDLTDGYWVQHHYLTMRYCFETTQNRCTGGRFQLDMQINPAASHVLVVVAIPEEFSLVTVQVKVDCDPSAQRPARWPWLIIVLLNLSGSQDSEIPILSVVRFKSLSQSNGNGFVQSKFPSQIVPRFSQCLVRAPRRWVKSALWNQISGCYQLITSSLIAKRGVRAITVKAAP
jgi:hypothetical protein